MKIIAMTFSVGKTTFILRRLKGKRYEVTRQDRKGLTTRDERTVCHVLSGAYAMSFERE